jgi:hypothetical protein
MLLSKQDDPKVEVGAPSHAEQLAGSIATATVTEMENEMHAYLAARKDEQPSRPSRGVDPVRKSTVLLLQGINDRTGRPVRVYITPTDHLICVETLVERRLERIWNG